MRLTSALDGFDLGAYHAPAQDARRGGLVLIHEIFGVTEAIRRLADGFAAEGFETIAPSLFDRQAPGFNAGYDADSVATALRYSAAAPWDEVAADLQAAIDALAPPVFAVGYCWGGAATWLAAARCQGLAAASSYYGRRIPELIAETPLCPIILHFGRRDASIPPEVADRLAETWPDLPIHRYDAGHGFASDRAADYSADAASLARLRTLQLFTLNGGGRGDI